MADNSLLSPDGAFVWISSPHEVRMSHWIECGILVRQRDQKVLFDAGSDWSFERVTWTGALIELEGRKYPGAFPGVCVVLDVPKESGTIACEDLAALHARGLYDWVAAQSVPAAPSGARSFGELLRWLRAYPAERSG
jgi:hypothetical protein